MAHLFCFILSVSLSTTYCCLFLPFLPFLFLTALMFVTGRYTFLPLSLHTPPTLYLSLLSPLIRFLFLLLPLVPCLFLPFHHVSSSRFQAFLSLIVVLFLYPFFPLLIFCFHSYLPHADSNPFCSIPSHDACLFLFSAAPFSPSLSFLHTLSAPIFQCLSLLISLLFLSYFVFLPSPMLSVLSFLSCTFSSLHPL